MVDGEPTDLLILLEIVQYLRLREERLNTGSIDQSTLEALRNLPAGVSIGSLVSHYSGSVAEVVMGDRYEVGQAGAVGPNSLAIGQQFHQIWNQAAPDLQLGELAEELSKVRESARGLTGGTPQEDLALAELAHAQVAAEDGDGPTVLRHLAKAGQWALQIAQQIGAEIVVKAIESAIGR